jgi:hypothetical protein
MLPDLFRRLKPLYGKRIDYLWLEHQTADMDRRREIEAFVTMLAVKKLGMAVGEEQLVLDAPPVALIGDGEFTLGSVTYPGMLPYPLRLRRAELLRHTFILGPTGTGKSTLILGMLLQLCAARVPFMAFDFKRNYRCLLGAGDVVVFTVARDTAPLRMNALRPPGGVGVGEWVEALSDIICTAYLLLHGARNVLKEALLAAVHEHGRDATLAHARAFLKADLARSKSGSRRYGWLESATRSVEELSTGPFGDALTASGAPVEELLSHQVVFELQGLGDDQKRFFCLLFLQAVLVVRKNSASARELLQHVLVFDEAHNVFPRERFGEVSLPARLAREVREYGEAIIAATQQADVSESLIANTGIKVILRCDYPRDVQFAATLLQIEPKWLPKLHLGTAIVRLPVRYYQPFLLSFDEQPIKNDVVPDARVRERWQARSVPVVVPRQVSNRDDALLRDIAAHPISPITQRYERLGWNAKTGNDAKDALIAGGLARFDVLSTPTARVKILSLTASGEEYLEAKGVDLRRNRAGGVEHEYWKWRVRLHLERQGYVVTEEEPVGGGKTVDVHAKRGSDEVWVEMETGRSDVMANAEKCSSLAGRIVFVFTDEQELRRHEQEIRTALPDVVLLTTANLATLS